LGEGARFQPYKKAHGWIGENIENQCFETKRTINESTINAPIAHQITVAIQPRPIILFVLTAWFPRFAGVFTR
jgi:hypothetical protein